MEFISDYIQFEKADKTKFNIVASGCGTGKTYWVANNVREHLPHIKTSEMLFVTSRSLIVEQQSKVRGITKFNPNNVRDIRYWNGEYDSLEEIESKGIQIMTYDKIINIIKTKNTEGFQTLEKIKIIFFDECHTLFSDLFIKDIECLKVWIRDILYTSTKYIIGLTATPRILFYYQKEWGVSVQQLNKDILVNYRAKQLYCTDFKSLHFLLANKEIKGKTMVMCYSVRECYELKEKIPNSFVLVSKSNKEYYTPEMDEVRQYIIDEESLPDTYLEVYERDPKTKHPIKSDRRNLEVLITTSTLREGVNLRECSGVRNMAISFTDELHISQWVGRCRYNIDNLIVAESYIRTDNYNKQSYLSQSRRNFKDYMRDDNHTKWFDSISHLVEHDITMIRKFRLTDKEQKFTTYINKKWLVPRDISEYELDRYKIYKEKDKNEIVNNAIYYQLIDLPASYVTFNRVIRFMVDTLGYVVESGRMKEKNKRYTYKLVVDFDEDYDVKKERKLI
ncbi:MAG TPA: DEAD/DEAH box helicase family protein [Acholeplasmataceae bacterium]|nr:DEAD/DEAH box helicase family protein [Acholeplasmataceae bacterium]